jgi:hypothetical protein
MMSIRVLISLVTITCYFINTQFTYANHAQRTRGNALPPLQQKRGQTHDQALPSNVPEFITAAEAVQSEECKQAVNAKDGVISYVMQNGSHLPGNVVPEHVLTVEIDPTCGDGNPDQECKVTVGKCLEKAGKCAKDGLSYVCKKATTLVGRTAVAGGQVAAGALSISALKEAIRALKADESVIESMDKGYWDFYIFRSWDDVKKFGVRHQISKSMGYNLATIVVSAANVASSTVAAAALTAGSLCIQTPQNFHNIIDKASFAAYPLMLNVAGQGVGVWSAFNATVNAAAPLILPELGIPLPANVTGPLHESVGHSEMSLAYAISGLAVSAGVTFIVYLGSKKCGGQEPSEVAE